MRTNLAERKGGQGGGYSVEFRRTEADRRPARPCVRPNDGPGDPKLRARLADEARQRAERKCVVVDKPKTAAEAAREQRDANRLAVLHFVAAAKFGADQRNMADQLGLQFSLVSIFVRELEATGLVETEITGRVGRGQSINVVITDVGADQAEAQSQ